MVNKVILLGNLGRDPELRTLDSGVKVARLPIATNENYKDRNGEWQTNTEWHNVVAWRALAEQAERSMKKGDLIFIEGKVSTRKYTDKDGIEKYATDIVANYMRIANKRDGSNAGMDSRFPSEEPLSQGGQADIDQGSATSEATENTSDTNEEQAEDDLPF